MKYDFIISKNNIQLKTEEKKFLIPRKSTFQFN